MFNISLLFLLYHTSVFHTETSALLPPLLLFLMIICLSIFSFSSGTWEIIPTSLLPLARSESDLIACCSDSSSSDPKPSSINMVSSRIPPADACISSESPSARESDALKDSPPESVRTLRSVPL